MPIEAGGNLLKKYGVGLFLSLVVLLLLFIVNAQIYRHVMLLNTPIILLSLHVIVYKHLMPEKRYGAYFLFVLVVGASFFFSLPEYTYQQAQEDILDAYGQDLKLTEQDNLPLERDNSWNPFAPRWGYAFVGTVPSTQEHISFLFIPDTGRILEIAP